MLGLFFTIIAGSLLYNIHLSAITFILCNFKKYLTFILFNEEEAQLSELCYVHFWPSCFPAVIFQSIFFCVSVSILFFFFTHLLVALFCCLLTSFTPPTTLSSCHLADPIHPLHMQLWLHCDGHSILTPAPKQHRLKWFPCAGLVGCGSCRVI